MKEYVRQLREAVGVFEQLLKNSDDPYHAPPRKFGDSDETGVEVPWEPDAS